MSVSQPTQAAPAVEAAEASQHKKQQGLRVNGQHWKEPKSAFRMNKGMTSFEKRMEERKNHQAAKSKIKEMKDEKETIRQNRIQNLKSKREAKAEKERFQLMAVKMHQKRVDRIKRREKRNKLLNS